MSYYLSRESSWARPSYQIDPHGEHIMSPLTRQLTETSDTSRCSDYSNQSSEYSISETSTEMPTYSFEGSSQIAYYPQSNPNVSISYQQGYHLEPKDVVTKPRNGRLTAAPGTFRDSTQRSERSTSKNNFNPGLNLRPLGTASTYAMSKADGKQYICLYPNCDKSFQRAFDLNRHILTHFPNDRPWIDCRGRGCGRYGKPDGRDKGGFFRQDHYTQHLRRVHNQDIPMGRGSGNIDVEWRNSE